MIQLQQQLTAVQVRRGPVYRAVSSLGTQVSILSFTPVGELPDVGLLSLLVLQTHVQLAGKVLSDLRSVIALLKRYLSRTYIKALHT